MRTPRVADPPSVGTSSLLHTGIRLLVVLSLASGCSGIFIEEDYQRESLKIEGRQRTWLVRLPPRAGPAESRALVILLHGGGGRPESMARLTEGGFDRLADEEGFILAYPAGVGRHWNDGRTVESSEAHAENVDDVAFISRLIDVMISKYSVHPGRVYAGGISNGAMMSLRLACDLSGKITAAAAVCGNLPARLERSRIERPVSVLLMNGTEDDLVPWEGGYVSVLGLRRGRILSVDRTVAVFCERNRCMPSSGIRELPDLDPDDGTRVRLETWPGGLEGTEVVLFSVEGGGHTWPGGRQYLGKWLIGRTSRDLDGNRAIWDFFKRHRR
jgi:polyhydroxybutyrate depolymerase